MIKLLAYRRAEVGGSHSRKCVPR